MSAVVLAPMMTQHMLLLGKNDAIQPYQLGLCEGDCDSNEDCQYGLVCYQKSSSESGVPGCEGTDSSSRDYCTYPWIDNQTVKVGDNYSPASKFPLQVCCHQRSSYEDISGCKGLGSSGVDRGLLWTGTSTWVDSCDCDW